MTNELLEYYDRNRRDLPWRKDRDPYHIWISEIMCQQTRVDTVIPYYLAFLKRLPDIRSLAGISEDELNKLWQGLGYYSRARNLQKAARMIVEKYDGIFPERYEDVLSLPGIGEYAASAICSMAYDQPYAAVDGNFCRVFTRLYEDPSDISKESYRKQLRETLKPFLGHRSGDFNQAVMDLGATICLPNREPLCDRCPLKNECRSFHSGTVMSYPFSSAKTKVTELDYTVFIICTDDRYVLHKRRPEGLLASLYEFPNVSGHLTLNGIRKMYPDASVKKERKKTHHFSHQTWNMFPYLISTDHYDPKDDEYLVSKEELLEVYSVPKAFNQFFDLLQK